MNTTHKLRVGAGTTVVAAFLTGLLTNGAVQDTSNAPLAKFQDRVPEIVEQHPIILGDEPLISPAFREGPNSTVIEMVPGE